MVAQDEPGTCPVPAIAGRRPRDERSAARPRATPLGWRASGGLVAARGGAKRSAAGRTAVGLCLGRRTERRPSQAARGAAAGSQSCGADRSAPPPARAAAGGSPVSAAVGCQAHASAERGSRRQDGADGWPGSHPGTVQPHEDSEEGQANSPGIGRTAVTSPGAGPFPTGANGRPRDALSPGRRNGLR